MRTMRGVRWGTVAAALAILLGVQAADAQSIRAVARDSVTGAPVPEAMVRVETAEGVLVAAAFVNRDGVAVLRVRSPGTYVVEVRRAGYRDRAVRVQADSGQAQVEVRLARRPFALDTVVVYGQRPNERGRQGFERRRSLGQGVFLDSAYVARRAGRVAFAGDLLRGVPGVYVVRQGMGESVPRSERRWHCMVLLLDGRPLNLEFPDGGRRDLHHVIGPTDVKAVEVYREFNEVPPEFRRYAESSGGNCGVFLYWTRVRW